MRPPLHWITIGQAVDSGRATAGANGAPVEIWRRQNGRRWGDGGVSLLVMPPGYATRETFDAACRIAGVHGSVVFESAALSTLAAFAEAGHGIAIVPAMFRNKGERVRIARLELRRKPVTMQLAVFWDRNKPLPRFADKFPELFSAHATALMREGNYILGRL